MVVDELIIQVVPTYIDALGIGKTLQTISRLGNLHEFRGTTRPHLVVAPKFTLGNWMNEIQRFCPMLRAVKFLGNPYERKDIRENLLVAGKLCDKFRNGYQREDYIKAFRLALCYY